MPYLVQLPLVREGYKHFLVQEQPEQLEFPKSMNLHLHVDAIRGRLHATLLPDVRISVFGADRPGIVAKATTALADAGLAMWAWTLCEKIYWTSAFNPSSDRTDSFAAVGLAPGPVEVWGYTIERDVSRDSLGQRSQLLIERR